jgi:hypothetical protein
MCRSEHWLSSLSLRIFFDNACVVIYLRAASVPQYPWKVLEQTVHRTHMISKYIHWQEKSNVIHLMQVMQPTELRICNPKDRM